MIDKDDHKSEFPAKNVYLESVPMTALKKISFKFPFIFIWKLNNRRIFHHFYGL